MAGQLTKRALEDSLKRLLLQKPLTKITIADLTEDCGVSRMTFYYHFQDIYDLVEWACEEEAGRALANNKTADTWQVGLENIMLAVRGNKPFIMNVYHCVSAERIQRFLQPVTFDLIEGVVEEHAAGKSISQSDKDFRDLGQNLGPRAVQEGVRCTRRRSARGYSGSSAKAA